MTSRANLNGEHGPPRRPPPAHAQSHHQHYNPTTSANLNGEHGPPRRPPPAHAQPHHQHYYPTTSANLNGEHGPPRRPPPAQTHHQHYYPTTSSSASFKGCCCCLFLLFSFLALLILAVVLVIILAVKPKKPSFDLQQVGVQYMGINTPTPSTVAAAETNPSTNPTTSASLSLNIRMLFTAVNPNRVGIKYGESKFTVMYRGIPLGKASVPGFFQEAHSVRQVEATIAVDRVNLLQADAADLVRDASLNDRVELRVLGDVGAKIRVLNFDSPGVQVSVDCAIVISPRKQSLTYKQCGFDGLSV
ncbi:NDR1/HIN1-like protein 13 [Juglans microcarpa x Juglans regia]|uniref:NDR1/HIN1-like protein 13 n=1 Tax=Juglans microcarpa x Juglans regia TaxID=2249226 RepID=UPI001B7EEBF2|nr:NDR1/HIN1-like protein 13 [Juglans microcarpa x Juglans regia]